MAEPTPVFTDRRRAESFGSVADEYDRHRPRYPRALIERLVLASSQPGQLVVDPFVGSRTTAVVAAKLGRRWLAGDSDARYVGLARERLRALSTAASASAPSP